MAFSEKQIIMYVLGALLVYVIYKSTTESLQNVGPFTPLIKVDTLPEDDCQDTKINKESLEYTFRYPKGSPLV